MTTTKQELVSYPNVQYLLEEIEAIQVEAWKQTTEIILQANTQVGLAIVDYRKQYPDIPKIDIIKLIAEHREVHTRTVEKWIEVGEYLDTNIESRIADHQTFPELNPNKITWTAVHQAIRLRKNPDIELKAIPSTPSRAVTDKDTDVQELITHFNNVMNVFRKSVNTFRLLELKPTEKGEITRANNFLYIFEARYKK